MRLGRKGPSVDGTQAGTGPNPRNLMLIGLALLVVGAVLPFLMVVQVVPSLLILSVVSYLSSVGGLFLGILGLAGTAGKMRRGADDHPDAGPLGRFR